MRARSIAVRPQLARGQHPPQEVPIRRLLAAFRREVSEGARINARVQESREQHTQRYLHGYPQRWH